MSEEIRFSRTFSLSGPGNTFEQLGIGESFSAWMKEFSSIAPERERNGWIVRFSLPISVRNLEYTLRVEQTGEDTVDWTFVDGGVVEAATVRWQRRDRNADPIEVDYDARVRLKTPVSRGIQHRIYDIFGGPALSRMVMRLNSNREQNPSLDS